MSTRIRSVLLLVVIFLAASTMAGFSRTNTVTVAYSSAVGSLDPHHQTVSDTQGLRQQMFEGFAWLDARLNLVPQLAVGWELADNGLDYTFYLRKGVEFHDGSSFDAYAVKANFDRLADSEWDSSVKNFVAPYVASVEVVDQYTVRITTNSPDAIFLNAVCRFMTFASPASLEAYGSELGGLDSDLVGTGPFEMKRWIKGERIELERFVNYWGGPSRVDGINYLIVPEPAARVTMLETGEADFILRVTPEDADYLATVPGVELHKMATNRVMFCGINMNNAPFDDVRVRQALNYAVDVPAITNSLFGAGTVEADCIVAPGVGGYAHIKKYSYDLDKAKSLLAEAGYPDGGFTVKMSAPKGRYVLDHLVAQAIVPYLEALGLTVELTLWGDFPAYIGELTNPERDDVLFLGWTSSVGEAVNTNYQVLHPSRANQFANTAGYVNEEVGRLMDLSRTTMDRAERYRLYREYETLVMEDAPWLFLYYQDVFMASRSELKGFEICPTEEVSFKYVWLVD